MRLFLPAVILLSATSAPIRAPTQPPQPPGDPPALITVELDSSHRHVVVTVGPFRVPAGAAMDSAVAMDMGTMQDSCVGQFVWPRNALLQGLHLELLDERGTPLPRSLLHHLRLVNFDRRDLVHQQMEHIVAFGQETEHISVPSTVGMPMTRGHRVGVVMMWNNVSGHDVESLRLRLRFTLNRQRRNPAPIVVLPFVFNVSPIKRGTFDVPPGVVIHDREFTIPVSGRLVVVGGHVHDGGTWLRLEDAATGHRIARVHPIKDQDGHVVGMSHVLALLRRGPHLRAGRRYRLLVRYENPTSDTLVGMGIMGGLFAPDDIRTWPAMNPAHADCLSDRPNVHGEGLDP